MPSSTRPQLQLCESWVVGGSFKALLLIRIDLFRKTFEVVKMVEDGRGEGELGRVLVFQDGRWRRSPPSSRGTGTRSTWWQGNDAAEGQGEGHAKESAQELGGLGARRLCYTKTSTYFFILFPQEKDRRAVPPIRYRSSACVHFLQVQVPVPPVVLKTRFSTGRSPGRPAVGWR